MAGDHRCPVCQSTFTRPQHVARHMRSHTGDRPYKCQICGDQFARSDLLSRHVNKCHAADKPANSTSRRRGSSNQAAAATARATIEAAQQQLPVLSQCDQCKHAGLGCDLRSPCTTCHQRRISCTFPRVRSSNRKSDLPFSGSAVYPPPNMSVPSLLPAASNLYSGSISDSGSSNYPTFYLPNSASDMHNRSSSSLSLHSNPTGTCSLPEHNLLNMFPQYATGANSSTVPTGAQSSDPSVSLLPPPVSAPATQNNFGTWNANGSASGLPNDFQSLAHNMNQPRPSSLVTDFMFDLPDSRPSTGTSLPSPRSLIDMSQPPVDMYGYRRSDQHSQSGTESDFSNSSPAVGRSGFATGGNPLLPMNNDIFAHQPVGLDGQLQQRPDNSNPFAFEVSQQGTGRNEVVSSAFGLLSLEEAMRNNQQAAAQFSFHPPPVQGQSSADMGAWSRPGSQAGRPETGGSSASAPADINILPPGGLPAISPATEAREMREFWKNFMCDPYATGDTPSAETPGAVRTPYGSRPGFLRGLSKSASLPPIRRQSFTNAVNDRYAYDDSTPHASMAQQLGHAVNTVAPPKSIINPTDLRSYEEAIRARPPTILKFEPRSRNGHDVNARGAGAGDLSGNERLNGSDSSRRGSIAGIPETSPIPSIRRIVPVAGTSSAAAAYSSSDDGSSRPSFKRLASQTLGPSYSKKAQHHRLGDPDAADSPTSSASDAPGDDDDSESSDERGMPNGHRRPRGVRSSRRSHNSGVSGVLSADRRLSIPATGA
ncbi:hypothetical protein BKA62DRAFT_612026 [Auriculariales sp. MPI-PUGE-AT-0066]|nr:hypothetical protein BKA62DRAFT_612026 [Auriculariales sp. MPI-PUGE-AT-0066]